jgi:phosphoglycerate dehydrogenase-like enzyme
MIDSAALALMKPTSVMVNTSRGGIVNEAALYQAISSGTCSVRASTSSRPSRRRRTIR